MLRFLPVAFVLLTIGLTGAVPVGASELTLVIRDGRVDLDARDVAVSRILEEWGRVGQTRIIGGDAVPGGLVTLHLVGVPERQALDIILRAAAGYLAAPRPAPVTGTSTFDRIIVLATSVASAAPLPPLALPALPDDATAPDMPDASEFQPEEDDGSRVVTPPAFPGRQFPRLQPTGQTPPAMPEELTGIDPRFPGPDTDEAPPPGGVSPVPGYPGGAPAGSSPIPGVVVPPPPDPAPPGS